VPSTVTASFSGGISAGVSSGGGYNVYTVTGGSGTVTFS
jgi:hypothetical protein